MQQKRILAVSSSGGHWVQLLRLRQAFEGHAVAYVTTSHGLRHHIDAGRFFVVRDASKWDKIGLVIMLAQILVVVLRVRPHVVITTGAAPGYFAIRLARLIGSKTIWIDSIANAEQLSLSGQMAGKYADVWLTQWPELAGDPGPEYHGAVI